jgi:serine/threonine protein kinase
MWAVGFIMYELLSGQHPLWNMVTDNRDTYQDKLKNNPKFKLDDKFSELAKTFFLHTCEYRPSNRYTVETALSHPWITRKKKSRIP